MDIWVVINIFGAVVVECALDIRESVLLRERCRREHASRSQGFQRIQFGSSSVGDVTVSHSMV